jgi:hypothetical protein
VLSSQRQDGLHPRAGHPVRAILEYGSGIEPGAEVELLVSRTDKQLDIWFTVAGRVHASARLVSFPKAPATQP